MNPNPISYEMRDFGLCYCWLLVLFRLLPEFERIQSGLRRLGDDRVFGRKRL